MSNIKQLVCPECKGTDFTIHQDCCIEGCDWFFHCVACGNDATCWSTKYHDIDTDLIEKED